MPVFDQKSAEVMMPREILDGMVRDVVEASSVAALSAVEPMRFGKADIIRFTSEPRAEFVEAGGEKSSSIPSFDTVTVKPHKAQVTMRFDQEVQWADEDHQMGIFDTLAGAAKDALVRALDLGLYHRLNPLTGNVLTEWDNYLTSTPNRVELTGELTADEGIRQAAGLLVNRSKPVTVNGLAVDPRMTWELSQVQNLTADGIPSGVFRFPELGIGTSITNFQGVKAVQASTVSGEPEGADTGVRAIIGDFADGIRWGIQKELPVELIRYGDPDGQGDLARRNQIAMRAEIVFGWHVFADRFALVTLPSDEGNDTGE